jgi:hypothetical protein
VEGHRAIGEKKVLNRKGWVWGKACSEERQRCQV